MPDVLPSPLAIAPASGDGAAPACLQCDTPLVGAYCHGCGQHESVAERLTFRSLWRDFRVRKLNLDRGLLRTLVDVVLRPGVVARAFVEGRRQTYTHPITLLFVVYAVYALILNVFQGPLDALMAQTMESQMTPAMTGDAEMAAYMDAYLDGYLEASHVFYAYSAYFTVFIVLPFALAARWLLGDRGRTVAECAVLGAYVEVAVVLPSMLVFTPLGVALRMHWIMSLPLLLYFGYAAWGARDFFDRRPSTAALSVLSMVIALAVYFGTFIVGTIVYASAHAVHVLRAAG